MSDFVKKVAVKVAVCTAAAVIGGPIAAVAAAAADWD